jgi:hypothetical protein
MRRHLRGMTERERNSECIWTRWVRLSRGLFDLLFLARKFHSLEAL